MTYVGTQLVRKPGPIGDIPAVLLLGPRGSGKTSLLEYLREWGRSAPLASLDLAAFERADKTLFDVLAELAYQIQARKDHSPRITFPSFAMLLLAAVAEVSKRDRGAAVAQMSKLLQQGMDQGDYAYESLQPLLDGAAAFAGGLLPGWVTQIIPVVRSTQRLQARIRISRRSTQASKDVGGPRAGTDFLVGVNHLFHGHPQQQKDAERLLFEAFLADLRAVYESRSGHKQRTAHCLVLLDNVDSELGESFLQRLLDSRNGVPGRAGRHDPLLVVGTARRSPEALIREEQRLPSPPDYALSWRERADRFTPVAAGGLRAGLLRDLDRAEVEEHAGSTLAELAQSAPSRENTSYWLGWITYGVSRGHPAVTGAVLDAVARFPANTPWSERIQRWPSLPARASADGRTGTVADATLDLLLADCDADLRIVLPRAAAALTQSHAEVADDLWRDVQPALRRRFEDDGKVAFHPATRFLLLRRLDKADSTDGPGSWVGAHHALRSAASDDRTGAYHALAAGQLDAAVDYLHSRFNVVPADEWCEDLSYIQRAPARWMGSRPEPARDRYARLVGTPTGDEARQAIIRLLAAGWITSHPRADRFADLFKDPLGDPDAELYFYIAEEFRVLRRLARGGEGDRDVFDGKVRSYGRKPW